MANDVWISFGGRRQKASELSPELRKKLGINDVVTNNDTATDNSKIKKRNNVKIKRCDKEIVSIYTRGNRSDNFLDIFLKRIARLLAMIYVKMKGA